MEGAKHALLFLASVAPASLDPELVASLPVEWARSNCLLPVRVRGELCVLTCQPEQVHQQGSFIFRFTQAIDKGLSSLDKHQENQECSQK